MEQVDEVIRRRLASDVAMINQISHYIIAAGGKRVRPMLVLLFSRALGFEGPEHFDCVYGTAGTSDCERDDLRGGSRGHPLIMNVLRLRRTAPSLAAA